MTEKIPSQMFAVGPITADSQVVIVGTDNHYWYTLHEGASAGGGASTHFFASLDPTSTGANAPEIYTLRINSNNSITLQGQTYVSAMGHTSATPVPLTLFSSGYNLPDGVWAGIPYTGLTIPTATLGANPMPPFGGMVNTISTTTITSIYFIPVRVASPLYGIVGPVLSSGTDFCLPLAPSELYTKLKAWMHGTYPDAGYNDRIFTEFSACRRGFVPAYCTGNQTCGNCFGNCPVIGVACTYDDSGDPTKGVGSFTCVAGSKEESFWDKYKWWIVGVLILLVVALIVILIVAAVRHRHDEELTPVVVTRPAVVV